jgi:hypothetical protein
VKLCVRNDQTLDGFVDGVDGIFEDYIETISKKLVWIHFHNSRTLHNTQIMKFPNVGTISYTGQTRTPIEHKIVKIKIGNNPSHNIMKIQFPIQLTTTCILHCSQRLFIDCLTFDPIGVIRHGLIYITLSRFYSKELLFDSHHYYTKTFKYIILSKKKCFD